MASSSSSGSGGTIIGLLIYATIECIVAKSGGCSPDDGRFQEAIRNSGLKNPIKQGYDFFECGYGDEWVESFTAKHPMPGGEDLSVTGTMCCGIMKGCTIRWP